MKSNKELNHKKIAVVIPAYKVSANINSVIENIGKDVKVIVVVDDGCPEKSGEVALSNNKRKVILVKHLKNQGVGSAMVTGYRVAMKNKADIIVKVDGDGQINPQLIPDLIKPIFL